MASWGGVVNCGWVCENPTECGSSECISLCKMVRVSVVDVWVQEPLMYGTVADDKIGVDKWGDNGR